MEIKIVKVPQVQIPDIEEKTLYEVAKGLDNKADLDDIIVERGHIRITWGNPNIDNTER